MEPDQQQQQQPQHKMNGVLFRVPSHMMPGFDRREVGYDKVQIPLKYIELCDDDLKVEAQSSVELGRSLRCAIAESELCLEYQPIVATGDSLRTTKGWLQTLTASSRRKN